MDFSNNSIDKNSKKQVNKLLLFQFKPLQKKDTKEFQLLNEYCHKNILPIYGDQAKIFLERVKAGKDRTCEFLVCCGRLVGLLIYKNQLSNEFNNFGIQNGFELKTTFLIEQKVKTSGLFLRLLMGRAAQMALQKNSSCIFGTVSAKKPEVLKVMHKLGFTIIHTFKNKYIENVDEYLICHKSPIDLIINETTEKFKNIIQEIQYDIQKGIITCQDI